MRDPLFNQYSFDVSMLSRPKTGTTQPLRSHRPVHPSLRFPKSILHSPSNAATLRKVLPKDPIRQQSAVEYKFTDHSCPAALPTSYFNLRRSSHLPNSPILTERSSDLVGSPSNRTIGFEHAAYCTVLGTTRDRECPLHQKIPKDLTKRRCQCPASSGQGVPGRDQHIQKPRQPWDG